MRILQFFAVAGATLALVLSTEARAAEGLRLQNVVQRAASAPEGQANPTAARTFRIAGRAVDAAGKPVAGAVVECWQNPTIRMPFAQADMEMKQRVTAGTDGSFEVRVSTGMWVLVGRKPGLALAWTQYWNVGGDLTEERLIFTPPTTLTGIVVDQADKPVADAEVWVSYACIVREKEEGSGMSYSYINGKPTHDYFSTRTAADGKFVIQGFPTNASADLAITKPGKILPELQRNGIGPDTMRCLPGQQDVKLVVEPAGSIEGKVLVQGTDQPLADVRLSLQANQPGYTIDGPREPARSKADGTFRLADLRAGSYQILAVPDTNGANDWVAERVSVTVDAGQTTRDVRVAATRGGFLVVAVKGSTDRQPVAGAGIYAFKETYQIGAQSGTNGTALLLLPSGDYQVSASKDDSRSEAITATVEAGRTNHIGIQLSPPPRITGVVRDASGAAVPGLQLMVFPQWRRRSGELKTDANGHYEMPWQAGVRDAQGPPCLLGRDVAHNLAVAQDIEEGTTNLDLRLERGLVVAGRVEDVNGKPLTNATVQFYFWVGSMGSQFTDKPIRSDAQGRFEMTALPPGRRISMNATAKGYGSASKEIQADADTNRVELEPCVLKVAGSKLAGEVVDTDEKPVARANVYVYGEGQPNGSVRTDDKGRFTFDAVCEGTIQVSANARNAFGNARAEAGDTNVVIHLGVNQSYAVRQTPKRPSLKGKPLPDLAGVDLGGEACPAGKPVLLCLFDLDQRPSRRVVKQLADQYDALRQKGLTVLGLQAAITTAESFKEWKGANPLPFPIGRVAEKADKTKWASESDSLPWLILTDGERRVTAEGFALDELEAKLKGSAN